MPSCMGSPDNGCSYNMHEEQPWAAPNMHEEQPWAAGAGGVGGGGGEGWE